ncbi:DUF559 domain-containing protein [Hyphobacterium sp. SN044]|uniref:endonuclease domain-containing protein n=1 Tax=Hyphobacterium sp. SN044 TaxID=2912575 RepID=UPI001F25F351|nr:DUF559 domain-containing protein [Hyphobacterium sp. SN044]MCF8880545.1 DUF559 domain-containing protein [Hyphobacterium sp. SN044]
MREQETRSREFARQMRSELTNAEAILWAQLQKRQLKGWHFRRQHPVGHFIADFACAKAKLVIEVDGATHGSDRELTRDEKRTAFLESRGWRILRVWNNDIYDNLDGVMDAIGAALPPSGPSGHLPRERGRKMLSESSTRSHP